VHVINISRRQSFDTRRLLSAKPRNISGRKHTCPLSSCWRCSHLFLRATLADKLLQSVVSVCPSVCWIGVLIRVQDKLWESHDGSHSTSFKKYNVPCAMKPWVTLKNVLVHPKDREDKEQTTECVYKVPCASCEKTYIVRQGGNLGSGYKNTDLK